MGVQGEEAVCEGRLRGRGRARRRSRAERAGDVGTARDPPLALRKPFSPKELISLFVNECDRLRSLVVRARRNEDQGERGARRCAPACPTADSSLPPFRLSLNDGRRFACSSHDFSEFTS